MWNQQLKWDLLCSLCGLGSHSRHFCWKWQRHCTRWHQQTTMTKWINEHLVIAYTIICTRGVHIWISLAATNHDINLKLCRMKMKDSTQFYCSMLCYKYCIMRQTLYLRTGSKPWQVSTFWQGLANKRAVNFDNDFTFSPLTLWSPLFVGSFCGKSPAQLVYVLNPPSHLSPVVSAIHRPDGHWVPDDDCHPISFRAANPGSARNLLNQLHMKMMWWRKNWVKGIITGKFLAA